MTMNYENYNRALKFAAMPTDLQSLIKAHAEHPKEEVVKDMLLDELRGSGHEWVADHIQSGLPYFIHNNQLHLHDHQLDHAMEQFDYVADGTGGRRGARTAEQLNVANMVIADLRRLGRHHEAELIADNGPVKVVDGRYDYSGPRAVRTAGRIEPDFEQHAYGGGEILYHFPNGGITFCADCMKKLSRKRAQRRVEGEELDKSELHPRQFVSEVHEEGPSFFCDGCNKEIRSSYGDPNEPDEDRD